MSDFPELQKLGEDSYEAVRDIIAAVDDLPPEKKSAVFDGLADLLESFQGAFSSVRRISQPQPDAEKTERVDVLVNWLREKTPTKN